MNTRPTRSRDMSMLALALSIPIRIYRIVAIPFTSGHCRFHPTCSEYALEALHRHGAIKGTWLTIRRMSRCHPWGGSGIDEVPE